MGMRELLRGSTQKQLARCQYFGWKRNSEINPRTKVRKDDVRIFQIGMISVLRMESAIDILVAQVLLFDFRRDFQSKFSSMGW